MIKDDREVTGEEDSEIEELLAKCYQVAMDRARVFKFLTKTNLGAETEIKAKVGEKAGKKPTLN